MLTIFWENPNVIGHDSTQIFRKSEKEGEFSLIGQCDSVDLEYTDTTLPTINKVYWYRLDFVDEFMATADSVEFSMGYYPTGTGPGPQELLRGTWQLGYFGAVNVGLMPSFIDMTEALGHVTVPTTSPATWHKFVAQGNIIYVPNQYVHTNLSPVDTVVGKNTPKEDSEDVIGLVFKNGYSFSARAPYADSTRRNQWVGFETEDLTTSQNVKDSELGAVMSMVTNPSLDVYGGVFKLVEDSGIDTLPFPFMTSTPAQLNPLIPGRLTTPWRLQGATPGTSLPVKGIAGQLTVFLILELLFD